MDYKKKSMSKKALIGVGVLIIFLSTILASAITAGVLIRSTGILQQKSIEIERTVRERLVTGLEVVSASAKGNSARGTINDFEFFVRLRAGSSPIKLSDTAMTISTEKVDATARLENPFDGQYTTKIINLDPSTNASVVDLDGDGLEETLYYLKNYSGAANKYDGFRIDFSKTGLPDFNYSVDSDLGAATEANPVLLRFSDIPVIVNSTTYGYVYLSGDVKTPDILSDGEVYFYVSQKSFTCEYTTLTPEVTYCAYPQVGNTDDTLDGGELLVIRYRVADGNELSEAEEMELQFIPKEGEMTSATIKMPNSIKTKMKLI